MVLALLLAVAVLTSAALAAPAGVQRTVPCDESIDTTPFPYLGNRQRQYRYRSVLNAIAVPPAYLQQVVATKQQPWRYWRKAGLVVRAGRAVTITVPSRLRARAAIVWGNSSGPFESPAHRRLHRQPPFRPRLRWRLLPPLPLRLPAAHRHRRRTHHDRPLRHRHTLHWTSLEQLTRRAISLLPSRDQTGTLAPPATGTERIFFVDVS